MGTFAIKDDFYLNGERFKLISAYRRTTGGTVW